MNDHNYFDTFIAVAADCPVTEAKLPQRRGGRPTVATMQFEMLHDNPFTFTQEEVLFQVWFDRQEFDDLADDEVETLRQQFFAKGQPCLRASPLTKTHGWGVQFDGDGRAAIHPMESAEYARLLADDSLTVLPAMRSKRA
ncbi:MAG: DUF6157 family protein [Acidimicrobiales bacterium]